jgi:hypothetical protein
MGVIMMGAVEGGNRRKSGIVKPGTVFEWIFKKSGRVTERLEAGHKAAGRIDDQKGSITAEASIIVPLVILCLAAVIYIGLLLYERSLVQSAAETAAEAGAAAWASGTDAIGTSRPAEEFELYRRIFDSGKEERLKKIEEYALALSSRNEIVPSSGSSAVAEIKDYAVYRKLEVTVEKDYKMPLGRFVMLFGGSDTITISVKAVSTINDPAEFIRTADLVIDAEKKLEERFPELKEISDKTRQAMNDLKDRLGKFMDR